jgi:hypothetical protein
MKALLVAAACGCALLAHSEEYSQQKTLDQGYREMYNLQFADAHRTFREWELAHPDDPMAPVSDAAAYLFSEFDRLKILQSELFVDNHAFFGMHRKAADPDARERFQHALAQTDELASRALAKAPQDANALLARVLRMGLDADYLALIDKKYLESLSEVKAGRALAEKLISEHPEMYDAYLASGVENYLLSQKPAPVRWVLHATGAQTDKQTGIEKLRITAEKGRYLKPYARLLLAVASLRDHDISGARQRLEWLAHEFPLNRLYREELAKLH